MPTVFVYRYDISTLIVPVLSSKRGVNMTKGYKNRPKSPSKSQKYGPHAPKYIKTPLQRTAMLYPTIWYHSCRDPSINSSKIGKTLQTALRGIMIR